MPILLKEFWRLALGLLLAVLAGAVLYTAFWTLPGVRSDLRETEKSLATSVRAAAGTLEDTRADLAATQAALVAVVDRRTAEITTETRKLRETVTGSVSKADGVLEALAKIPAGVSPVLEEARTTVTTARSPLNEAAATLKQVREKVVPPVAFVADAARDMTDCDPATGVGASCIQNRLQGASKNVETVTHEAARVAPETASNIRDTTKHLKQVTSIPMVLARSAISGAKKFIGWIF